MMTIITWVLANKKLLGYITGAVGFLVSLYQLHSYVYDSGRESMRVEIQSQYNEQLSLARKEYEQDIQSTIMRMQANHNDEIERVANEKEIITKVETVTEYVDKEIIVQAECDALASDVISVLKQAANISTNSEQRN